MRAFVHWLVCVMACLSGTLLHAVELVGQPQVTATANTATLQWRTDVDCGTRLQFGLKSEALDRKAEGAVTRDHSIQLEALTPDTTYYYSVGSARTRLATGTFTTTGGSTAAAAAPQPSLLRRVLNVITPDKKPAPTVTPAQAPPTRKTWGHLDSLQDHFNRHGRDFSSTSPDDYAAQAWLFLQRGRAENLPMKLDDTDGTLRVFDPTARVFGAYNSAGLTKTFFKPDNPTYWQHQPGRVVKPADLRFSSR